MRRLLAGLGAVAGLTLGVITGGVLSAQPAHAEGILGVDLTSTVEVVADTADTTTTAVIGATSQINVDQPNDTSPSITETVGEAASGLLENAVTGGGTDTAAGASATGDATLPTNASATSTVDGNGAATAAVPGIASVVANADVQVNLTQPTNEPVVDANVCAGVGLLGAAANGDCAAGESSGGGVADITTDGQVNVALPVGSDESQINGDVCLDASVLGASGNQCAESNQPDDAENPPANEPNENGLLDIGSVVDLDGTVDPVENLPAQNLDVNACLDASVLGGASTDCTESQDGGLVAAGSTVEVGGLVAVGDTPIVDLDNGLCLDASVLGSGENGCTGRDDAGVVDVGSTIDLADSVGLGQNLPAADLASTICLDASVLGSDENGCTGSQDNGLVDLGSTVHLNNAADLGENLPTIDLSGDACIEASVLGNDQNDCTGGTGGLIDGGSTVDLSSNLDLGDGTGVSLDGTACAELGVLGAAANGCGNNGENPGGENPGQGDGQVLPDDGSPNSSNSADVTPGGGVADVPVDRDAGTNPNGGSGSGNVDAAGTGSGNANGSGGSPNQDEGADDRSGRVGQSGLEPQGPGTTSSVPTLFIPRTEDAHPVMMPAAPASTNARNLMPNTGQPGSRIAGASPAWLWMLLLIAGALSVGAGAALRRHHGQAFQSSTR